jgi:DNA-binding beta-propeller fold protein YncE
MSRVKPLVTALLLCLVVPARGAQEVVDEIFAGNQWAVAVNQQNNQIYLAGMVVDGGAEVAGLSIYDGQTHELVCAVPFGVPVNQFGYRVAANPVTGRVYVANLGGAGTVSVVDAAACSVIENIDLVQPVTGLAILTFGGIAVNPNTNRIYATGAVYPTFESVVAVIDGATNDVVAAVQTGSSTFTNQVAVNPVTNRVYVTDDTSETVTVIDGGSNTVVTSLAVSRPNDLVVNPATDRIYVTSPRSEGGGEPFRGVSIFDGTTHALLLAVPMAAGAIDLDADANRVYVDAPGAGVTIRDADDLDLLETVDGIFGNILDLAVNSATNFAYAVTNAPRLFVIGPALEAEAGPDQAVLEGQVVTLAGAAEGGQPPYTFAWTQTGGASVSISNPASPSPSFTASDGPDVLTFTLTVTDARGRVAQDSVQVVVANVAPTVSAGADQTVLSGDLVTLAGSGSDPVDPITFSWLQTSGPAVALSCTAATCTFTAPAGPQVLTFQLTVSDDDGGSNSATVTITVRQDLDAEASMVARPPLESPARGATNFRTMWVRVCNVGATAFTVNRAAHITLSITVNGDPAGGAIVLRNPGSATLAPGACDRANFRWNYRNAGPAAGQIVTFGATLSTGFAEGSDVDPANNVDERSLTAR